MEGDRVKYRVDTLPVITGIIILTVGITLMYSPISDVRIGYYDCYGAYGFLIIFAGIAFLLLALVPPVPNDQSEQNGQNKQNEQW
jgi:hypothetical protein